ncbi:Uncharacterised protein [Klebsiella pneumoniae]|nr:Uncharacterised protein [Klebsiella pneumoniae]
MITSRQATRYGIPCPQKLSHLKELLPASAPIRLACLKTEDRDGSFFLCDPQNCFSNDKQRRSDFIDKFWEQAERYIRHDTQCIIRQHGRQTVLQLNI